METARPPGRRRYVSQASSLPEDVPPLSAEALAKAELADAEWAETKFRLIKQCGDIALIEAAPHTGRLHQIRATLLAMGCPIVGDKLYGVDETLFLRFCKDTLTDADRARLRMDRQALHASGLRFHHPKFGRPVTIDLDLPEDMKQLLNSMALRAGATKLQLDVG